MQPTRAGYINAIQVYPFSDGALYQVYARPARSPTSRSNRRAARRLGPVAAGDTCAGSSATRERAGLPSGPYPAQADPARPRHQPHPISWLTPTASYTVWIDAGPAFCSACSRVAPRSRRTMATPASHPRSTSARHRGDERIVSRLRDGPVIEFPAAEDSLPLWVLGAGGGAELVNYRVQGNHMI